MNGMGERAFLETNKKEEETWEREIFSARERKALAKYQRSGYLVYAQPNFSNFHPENASFRGRMRAQSAYVVQWVVRKGLWADPTGQSDCFEVQFY